MPSRLRRSLPLLVALPVALSMACERPRAVAVHVMIPGADSLDTPAAGVGVVALPYDRDSVLRLMAATARTPRPSTAALDTLFAAFKAPFVAFASASAAITALGDSIGAAERRLAALAPGDAARAGTEQQLARLRPLLAAAEARKRDAGAPLDAARAALRGRGDSLRALVRAWENTTYAGYDSVTRNAALRAGRGFQPVSDTTDARGWATLPLREGQWWIYVRAWDALDPNAEWYWNVPLTADTLRLDRANARHQPKY